VSWLHGVIVPVQVVVAGCQLQPLVHSPCCVYVLHAFGVPAQFPPMPASAGVHVQPSAVHAAW
jgi:hypothetical protein